MIIRTLAAIVLGHALACSQSSSRREPESATASMSAPLITGDSAIIPGACPFECCQYGRWKLRTVAELRAAPSASAPSLGQLAVGTEVNADTGIVILNPVGLAVAMRPFVDSNTRLTLNRGDTLVILNNLGEGEVSARLHDSAVQIAIWDLDTAGQSGLKLIRPPGEYWWAHFVVSDSMRGWVLMDNVDVLGADACGS